MPRLPDDSFYMKCPGCGKSDLLFHESNSSIEVNIESKQMVEVPGMKSLFSGCENPECKWSKVPGDRTFFSGCNNK